MVPTAFQEARAKRFPMHLPVKYRRVGEKRWFTGTTGNVSCSGMLVHGRHVLSPESKVQLLLTMPFQLAGKAQLVALCNGEVVRKADHNVPPQNTSLGISIASCELLRNKAAVQQECTQPRTAGKDVPRIVQGLYELLVLIVGSSEVIASDNQVSANAKQHAAFIRNFALRASALLDQIST